MSSDDQPKKKVRTTWAVVVAAHDNSQTLPNRITLSKPAQENKDMLDGTYDGYPYKLQRFSSKEPRVNEIIDIHRGCQHDKVLQVLTVESTESYHILVFKNHNCTLEQYLQKHNMSTPRSMDIDILKGIVLGLSYLHNEKKVAHRKLRTSNVFIRRDEHQYTAKLGDLGNSKRVKDKDDDDLLLDLADLAVTLLRCVSFDTNQDWQDLKNGFGDELNKLGTTNPDAYYLIMKILTDSSLKTSEVLLGPFFWDWMKRLNFLANVDEVVDENKCNLFEELKKLGAQVFGDVVWKKTIDQEWLRRMLYHRSVESDTDFYKDHLLGFLKLVRDTSINILGNIRDPYDREELERYLHQNYPKFFALVYRTVEANEKCRKHRMLKHYFNRR